MNPGTNGDPSNQAPRPPSWHDTLQGMAFYWLDRVLDAMCWTVGAVAMLTIFRLAGVQVFP